MNMLSSQQIEIFRMLLVVFLCFALLTTEITGQKTKSKHSAPYDLRLVAGGNRCEGRLEGKQQGEWRPLHHHRWTEDAAKWVCMKLDCGSIISSRIRALAMSQPVWDFPSHCRPLSTTYSCYPWGKSKEAYGIMVNCSESVRLLSEGDRCTGKLEVNSGESWDPVCESAFDWQDAAVVCRELGCGLFSSFYGTSDKHNWSKQFNCEGKEKRLQECPTSDSAVDSCRSGQATVECIERPRKPGISVHTSSGELFHNAVIFKGQHFAIRCFLTFTYYTIHSLSLECAVHSRHPYKYTQTNVSDSAYFLFAAANDTHGGICRCYYSYDENPDFFSEPSSLTLTIEEPRDVRLVGEHSRCAGRLELEYQKVWRPVAYMDSWSLKEAAVVCKQLDCGSAVSATKHNSSASPLPMWRILSDCDGSESLLVDCGMVKMWPSSSTVDVVCSDILLQPNLTVYTFMNGFSEIQDQTVELFKRHRFTVSCSVQPQYPGGRFSLIVNETHIQTQEAVSHSAHFQFPAANDSHQGNYRCVYHNYALSHNVSSESQTISFTVTESEELELMDGDSRCAGKLVISYNNYWRLLSWSSSLEQEHARIVCRNLNCGSAVSTKRLTNASEMSSAWRFFSDCDGTEESLLDCGTVSLQVSSSTVEVVCSDHEAAAARRSGL